MKKAIKIIRAMLPDKETVEGREAVAREKQKYRTVQVQTKWGIAYMNTKIKPEDSEVYK